MPEAKLDTAPPRGMRDVLPDEVSVRDRAIATILDVYRRHGFVRIETPAVESLALLTRSEGGENEKLIYKILKRGEKLAEAGGGEDLADLGLRFDLTVPLARYYANNHAKLPQPLKAIQIGPVWRAERPQKGRYRQFTQCDIDILGVSSEVAEIELILATAEALLALGLRDLTVRINDRRLLAAIGGHCGFAEARFDSVFIALDKLDKVGPAGVAAELSAAGHPAPAIRSLEAILGAASGKRPPRAALDGLAALLGDRAAPDALGGLVRIVETVETSAAGRFGIELDPTLARGMGYYTGPIFEIRYRDSASSIAGGGRYDRMVGKLLGRDVPATGFSIGFERVIGLLMEEPPREGDEEGRVALVFDGETPHLTAIIGHARDLRAQGRTVLLEVRSRRGGRQLQDLESRGFTKIGVVGPDGAIEWRGMGTRARGEGS